MVKISVVRKDDTVEKLVVPNENKDGMDKRILDFIYPWRKEYETGKALPVYPSQEAITTDIPKKPFIRGEKRLPNTSVIDPETLDLKQAMKKEVFIRCPHCGQSYCAIVSDGSKGTLIMKYDNTFCSVKNAVELPLHDIIRTFAFDNFVSKSIKTTAKKPDELSNKDVAALKYMYYTEMHTLLPSIGPGQDINAETNTQLLCPVCGKQDDLWRWINAYINPLNYFETDNICNVCGNEVVYVPDKDGKGKNVCEKCGNVMCVDDKKLAKNVIPYNN